MKKTVLSFFIGLVFLFNCKAEKHKQEFTFKQGIALNHWVSYPFKGWDYGDGKWFNENDVQWIANQGFDHIKVFVSGRQLTNPDFTLDEKRLSVLDSLISWNEKEKLGTIITLSMFPAFKVDTTLSFVEKKAVILKQQLVRIVSRNLL